MTALKYFNYQSCSSLSRHGQPKGSHLIRIRPWVAVAVLGILFCGPVREAIACWYDPIIFDPQALFEHTLQLVQLREQVSQSVEQLRLQALELAKIDVTLAPDLVVPLQGLYQKLQVNLYTDLSAGVQLETRFPSSLATVSWSDYLNLEVQWTSDQRQSLTELRELQNRIYQDQTVVRDQVQRLLDTSNTASGETAAIQVHNDLIGAASGELGKLQTLKLSQSRRHTERRARLESELSFAAAESQRVRGDWANPPPPTANVVGLFSNE